MQLIKISALIIVLGLSSFTTSFGQLENKVTAYVFLGVPLFPSAGSIQGQNIYNGYAPIPYLGLGLNYNLNSRLAIGANIKQLYTTKSNYTLSNSNLGVGVKFNFVPMDKPISPFVSVEGNLGYLTVSQKANSTTETVTNSDPNQVLITSQVRNYPEIKTGFSTFGVMMGAGVDFTLKLKYSFFVSLNYLITDASTTFTSQQNFADNTSKFQFFMPQVGVRFSFLRKKSLY